MSEDTERELLELIKDLIAQGKDRVTSKDLEATERRIGDRLEGVEVRLGSIEEAQSQTSGRIAPLEVAMARDAKAEAEARSRRLLLRTVESDDGKGSEFEVWLRIPERLRRIAWRGVLAVAAAAVVWTVTQLGVDPGALAP